LKRLFGIDPVHHRTLNPDCREPGLFGTGKIREGEIVAEGVVIAVVDDDESARKAIKRLIGSFGLNVEDFASAEEFLSCGHFQESSCVILDVQLPGMSGFELQSQLVGFNCQVPIIFISAHADEHTRARALNAGAVDFLQKPFSEGALLSALIACESPYRERSL
jgi:FixJ family two-component response regulator